MKTINSFLSLILMALFIMSCGNDEPASVSKDKAEEAFNTTNDEVATELAGMAESPGYIAMESLSSLNSGATPFGRIKSMNPKDYGVQVKSALSSMRTILQSSTENGRVSSDVPFDFDNKKGVYEYNGVDFDYTPGGTVIKILYPTDGSATNDAEFEMTDYDEEMDSFGEYNPTLLNATIKIDGTLEAEINLTASYDTNGDPTKMDLHLFLNPYIVDLFFDNTGNTTTKVTFSFLKGTTVIIDAGITATYTNKAAGELSRVTGYLQLMNVRFDADVTEQNQIITVKVDGGNAGKVVVDDATGIAYLQYNDGTQVPLDQVFGDLAVQLENIG